LAFAQSSQQGYALSHRRFNLPQLMKPLPQTFVSKISGSKLTGNRNPGIHAFPHAH
jgi:hypothetical protein